MINNETATEVEKQTPAAHHRELLGTEQTCVAGPAVDMQAHRLGNLQQLIERLAASRVAERQLVGDVVEIDPHTQRLGYDRELAADVAVTDDAEGAPAHLMSPLG